MVHLVSVLQNKWYMNIFTEKKNFFFGINGKKKTTDQGYQQVLYTIDRDVREHTVGSGAG